MCGRIGFMNEEEEDWGMSIYSVKCEVISDKRVGSVDMCQHDMSG